MADNLAVTPGSGATVAADDVGGVLHQRVKLALGADGSAVDAVAGAGAVGTGVQRTTLASDDPAVTSLAVIDDWDETDRCKVNPIAGQAGVAAGAGAVGATTQRVTLASDDPLVAALKAEDAASADGDKGFILLAVRKGTPANSSGTDGDYEPLQMLAGRLWARAALQDGAGANLTSAARGGEQALSVQVVDASGNQVTSFGGGSSAYGAGGVGSASFTRPGDTTAYAANDAVADSTSAPTALTFAGMGRTNAGTGYVVKGRLTTSQTTNTARFRLHLFKAAPTAINDNAGCTAPLAAVLAHWVGFIDFPAMQTGGGSPDRAFAVADARLHFKCDTADTQLYGLLQTLDAFTPANAQTFQCYLDTEQD